MQIDGAPSVELTAVPFFPQTAYQCGPAALSTMLAAAGEDVAPDDLVSQVYLPGREGSLQFELMAAARHEVRAGNPVLVLQNLGLDWHPQWHFAVVVGFDLSAGEIILRSGEEARHVIPLRLFERTWERGGYWTMVVMPPDRLPRTAQSRTYTRAIVELERLGRLREAATAYEAALARWPDNVVAGIGLGNSLYALGDLPGAESAYRRAALRHPERGVAFNNLAQVLADRGRLREAEEFARRAVELGGPMRGRFEETLEGILADVRRSGATGDGRSPDTAPVPGETYRDT
jgi:tetratricopeptide (TPR) repeat protein